MDGTYNNPYAQGQSPLTPDTPSGGAYKVNVNRSKTRKWVEAKVQNYDGDDWGDEYSDEDEPEPVPPPPPVSRITTGLRPVGQRLPSETRPSTRLADITASGSPNTSGPPSLQLQTGQSVTGASGHGVPPIPAHVQDSARSTPSPIAGRTASPVPLPSQQRQASFPLEPRSSTPLSQTTSSTPARVSPLSHPSELYRPEEDRKSTASPLFTRDNVASKPAEKSTPPSEETGHQVINAPPTAEPVVDPPAEQRGSVSLLPDMKRLSIFSSDFFSSSSKNEPQDVKAEPPGNKPKEIGQPDNVGKEVPKSDESANNTAESRPQWNEPSFSVTGPAVGLVSQAPVLPIPDPRSVPPLRTPSPNAKGTIPSEPMSSTSARTMNSEITPTEPLQPRRPDLSPADYEPQPIQSEPINLSASTSSPVKESDMLSDEILRTLSPVGATPPPLSAGAESSKQLAPGTRQDTRSSSYTLRDYDSYWEDSTDKPAPESKDPAPATAPPRDPTPEPQPLVPQADGSAIAPVMSPSSDETPGLRKRFSWEADFENKALKTQQPTGEPPKVGLASTEAPSSLGQSNIQSPKDAVSDITSPRSDTPKIVIPPTSEDSATPPPVQPLPSMLEPASPVSTRPEETTSQGAEERRPSVLSDKMPSETLSRVVSETPPLDTQSTTSTTPLTKPRPIPQVKGVKEIMAMGTSEKRITEYEESRKAFAEADLGLETWILAIKQQHPEFANVTSSFSGNEYQASVAGASVAGSNASSAPAQAPYYQQYLNASSPTTTGPPPAGRSRMGGSSLSTQATSAFGNSSNQIGSKSKELMHSAGKMGKGLFSKGRSKLRGTGDKGEPIPPPVVHHPPKPKKEKERRASWSLSIGARSRTEPAANADKEKKWLSGYYPPSSSQSRRMRAFRPASWGSSEPGRRRVSLGSLSSRISSSRGSSAVSSQASLNDDAHEASSSHSRAGQEVEVDVRNHRSRWDRFKFKQRHKAPPPVSMSAPVLALAIPAPITTPAPTPAPAPASSPTLAPPTPPTPAPLPPQPQPPSPLASPAPAAPASTVSAASSIRSDGVSSEHSGVQLNEDVGSIHTHEDETAPAPPASIDESDEVSFSDDDWVEIVTPHSTAASIRMVPAEPALVEARPSLSLSLATNASSSTVVASARGGEARLTPQTPASRSQASFQAFFQAAQAAQAAAHQNQANHNNQRQPAAVAQVQTRHKPKPQTQQTQPQTHSQSPQTKAQAQKSSQSSGSQTHTQTNTLTQRTKDMSLSSAHQQQPAPLPHQHRHQRQEPADDIPQRNSSFIGLPPIRRGSTFGMSSPSASTSHSQAARPTAERFPLDDDDEVPEERTPHPPHPAAIPGPVPAPAPPRLPGNTTVAGNGAIRPDGANFETSRLPLLPLLPLLPPQHTQQQGAAHPTQASRMPDQPVHMSPPPGPPEQSDPVRDPMHPHSPGSSEHHQSSSPFGGPAVAGSAASGSSSGAPPMMPPNSTGNPIQKLPPSGPWKLEESHLSEPLHSVSRNRAGTGSSQQQPYFGYDKETGVTLPSQGPPVVPPDTASSPRPRHKPSEVPPSSTRRYPELFARGDPRARSNSNVGPVLPSPQLASGRLSQDIGVPRAVTAGPETEGNGEERGRRKSSGGLFNRLTKPSSERRGSSSAEPIATPPHVPVGPADESSQSSIPIHEMHPDQRKPPRGSFLFSLRGRPSMDPPPQPQQAVQPPAPVQAPMQASVQAPVQAPMQAPPPIGQDQTRPETPQSQSERKHSRFGSGLGAITGGHKVKPTGLPRSSTSSMVNEPNSSAEHMAPPKKRFSGFGSKGGIFHRQSIDIVPKPGTPGSMRPSTGSATPDHVGSMAPPPPIGFMRSNTDGPGPFAQSTMQAQDLGGQDRRKRRGSAGGLISGFLGHSKKSQSQSGPIGPPQGQNQGMQPLPPGQNPLGQHPPGRSPLANPPMNQSQGQFDPRQAQGQFPPGHPGLQQNYQMQVSNGQPSGLAPQLPPLGPVSPVQLPGQMPWGQPSSGTPGQAPPPGQSSTHPPALRRMTGESLDSQLQPNTERPGSSGVNPPEQNREFGTAPEQNGSQVSLNQPRPSPLGQESPLVSKAAHAESSVHDSPRPSVNTTIPAPTDDASIHMRSGSRGVSPTRSVPLSHASNHTPKPSLDTTVQRGDVDTTEPQRPTMDSPSLSFRSAQPGHARTDSHNRDELPLSPVSQLSRTGPPSIASSNLGQSPRLASAAATVTGRGSQPGTPLLSMTSNTPPMQNQGFAPRMAPPPQQHSTPSSPLQQQQHQHHQDLQSPNLQQHQQPQPSFSPTPQQQQQQQQQRQQSPTSPFQQQGQQQRQPLASPFPQQQQQQQKPPPSPFQQQEQKALSSVAPPHQQSSASPFQQQGQRQQQQPPASPFQQQGQYQQQQPPSSPFQQQQQQRPPLSPFQQQGQQQQQVLPPPGLQQNRQQQQHQILGPQQNNAPSRTQSPSLQTRPSFQTMPSPSSQSSIPVSRPSLQMQRPPGSPMTPNPHGPPPAMMNPPVGQATSSKWKGLRNRMSAQMVAKPQHEQGKPKEKTSKLFGAFKRSSKSTPQQPQTPQVAQGQQGHQNLHGFFHPHHGHHPQGAPIQQQMYPPGQQMQPSQQMPPPGQQMALRQQVPPGQQMSPRQQMPPGQIRPGQPIAVGQQVPLGQRMPPPEQQMTPGQQVPPGQVRLSQQIMVGQQMPPPGQQMPPGQSSPDQKQMPQPQQMRPGQPIAPGQQQGAPGQQSALVQQPRPGQSSPIGQHAPPGQLPPGQQIRPGQQSPPIQQPQQFVGQVSHPQSYARRHASQLTSPSSGQKPLSPPTSTSPPMGQQPFSPVNSTVGQQPRPPAGQAVVGPRQGTPKGFQRPFQPQPQQQRPGQRFTEPQYDQVPIPQGYVAVHGEGVVVPSPYNVGRNLNHQSSFQHPPQQQAQPQMSQQVYSQPQSPASMASPSGLRGQPLSHPQTPMSHPTSPQNDGRVGIDPGYRTVQGETRPPATPRGGSIDDSWQAPPQVQRVATNASQVPPQVQRVATTASHASSHGSGTSSETPGNETPGHIVHMHSVSALGSETQSNGPRSPPPPSSENGFLKPQNATTPPSLSAGSITPSREPGSPVGNEQNGTREEYSRPISLSPPIGADDKASPSISHAYSTSAVSDEPNVVAKATKDKAQTSEDVGSDTNEGVRLHVTGESQRDVAHRQLSNGALMRSQTRNRGAPAELEDTEDAHARKMRLAGQEEKIHYDPDADSDGEPAPQMVATSYPGQEWNPYGMPEYGEWND